MSDDFATFFQENASSGGGAPSFKFAAIGSGLIGTVVSQKRAFVTEMGTQDPKLDKNGNKQAQLNVVLQTKLTNWDKVYKTPTDEDGTELPGSEDTGLRAIYVKHRMIDAVSAALKEAGVKALATGGTLGVKKTGETPTKWANGIPDYAAKYTAPEASDEFFADEDGTESAKPVAKPKPAPVAADDEPPF